jgi:hypothetical protein
VARQAANPALNQLTSRPLSPATDPHVNPADSLLVSHRFVPRHNLRFNPRASPAPCLPRNRACNQR